MRRNTALLLALPGMGLVMSVLGQYLHLSPVIVSAPLFLIVGFWARDRKGARRRQIERRREAGRCLQCGYSLAGNTSGVCPECGSTITKHDLRVIR